MAYQVWAVWPDGKGYKVGKPVNSLTVAKLRALRKKEQLDRISNPKDPKADVVVLRTE